MPRILPRSFIRKNNRRRLKRLTKKIEMLDFITKWLDCFVFCLSFLSQVLLVSAAERWCGFRPSALFLCHPHSAGLLHSAVWTGRLRPGGIRQWLHQRTALRTQPDQRARGKGHGTPQDLQVSLGIISWPHFILSFNCQVRLSYSPGHWQECTIRLSVKPPLRKE